MPPLSTRPHPLKSTILYGIGLLLALDARSRADEPRPPEGAVRLIGDEAAEFTSPTQPIAGVRLPRALGTSDFSIGLSFQADEWGTRDLGDLISFWDPKTRHGFSLGVRNNTGVTSSQPNWRQLQFGIDAGTTPSWIDEGRPGEALLAFTLAIHDGQLYAGTCEPNLPHVGRVYRYEGSGRWVPVGKLDGSNSVTSLASFDGHLYAATGKYRLAGSSLPESQNTERGGRVYRLDGPDRWELAGELPSTEAVAGLVTFGGKLYASSLYKPAGFFRYDGGQTWTPIPTPNNARVEPLAIHDGSIYAGSYDGGSIYRFDGQAWHDLGLVAPDITQNYAFATYQNSLHVGVWPSGKVYRLGAEGRWADAGRLGNEHEVMGMLVHNGCFYAGSLPKAEVYRYEGGTDWTLLKQLDETPDVRYRRVWAMATFKGRLFASTLPSGKVWSMSAGSLATHDHELKAGWHDLIARRVGDKLQLILDGQPVAEASGAGLDLKTEGLELKVGDGPRGRFVGSLKNAWFEFSNTVDRKPGE